MSGAQEDASDAIMATLVEQPASSSSEARQTLFEGLSQVKAALEDLLDHPSATSAPVASSSKAPMLHPFDRHVASTLGYGPVSHDTQHASLSRSSFNQTLSSLRSSLDRHRARILPPLIKAATEPSQLTAATPEISLNGSATADIFSSAQRDSAYSQVLKERYLTLLREDAADNAALMTLASALKQPCQHSKRQRHSRRLPRELILDPKAKNTVRKRKIALLQDEDPGTKATNGSGMTFPRSAMKGKGKASESSVDDLPAGSSPLLSKYAQLSKQLQPGAKTRSSGPSDRTLEDARDLLFQLSAALSSTGEHLGLEHLEEKMNIPLSVLRSDQAPDSGPLHTHTLTIAGRILVLDIEFWLKADGQEQWLPNIKVKVSYATVDSGGSEKAVESSQEGNSVAILLAKRLQSLAEAWLKSSSLPLESAHVELEEKYFASEDCLLVLVDLDRISTTGNTEQKISARDAFAELDSASQEAYRHLTGSSDKAPGLSISMHDPLPYLNLKLGPHNINLRLRSGGGYALEAEPKIDAKSTTLRFLFGLLCGISDVKQSQSARPFLQMLDQSKEIAILIDVIPIAKIEQVQPVLHALQQQIQSAE